MITLGINCAGRWTNMGIADDGRTLAELDLELGRRQSEELPLMTAELLARAGLSLRDIGLTAVGVGPGYYTGIRAGIAYGAALAEALNVKVTPLSSLEIFVWDLKESHEFLLPLFKARRTHCYAALYHARGGELSAVIEPRFIRCDVLAEELKKYPGAVMVSPDADEYPALASACEELIKRKSARGGSCAIMGNYYAARAVTPREVRGCYLREPDIGPN
ncbi:MAG: tRNA (adenosine(37)-N6)-threonylcarbamoyltransferase complex dimerization subunit type 1 TsaB [Synergistaceae bacterium]|nr:tRNA (adenosine(37)-N6)-threonylcarbamoyltransferase complex dimerization subunit type 1 TsaB [Synergistaceae bacterium]